MSDIRESKIFKKDLRPGRHRLEAAFYGWRDDEFNAEQYSALKELPHPLLGGEMQATTWIELTN